MNETNSKDLSPKRSVEIRRRNMSEKKPTQEKETYKRDWYKRPISLLTSFNVYIAIFSYVMKRGLQKKK